MAAAKAMPFYVQVPLKPQPGMAAGMLGVAAAEAHELTEDKRIILMQVIIVCPTNSPTHSPSHSPSHSPTHSLTYSPTHSPTHSLT